MQRKLTVCGLILAAIVSAVVVVWVGSEILGAASHRLAVGDGPTPTPSAWATLIGSVLSMIGCGWAASWIARFNQLANVITPVIQGDPAKAVISSKTQSVIVSAIEFGRLALYVKAFNEATTPAEREGIRKSASSACTDLLNQLFPPESEGKA